MRPDLLGLDDDALTALANRGLVKRARKEVDRGDVPILTMADDGTVTATFDDGTVTRLPPDVSLRDAPCSCPSTRVCRHRLAAVMAVRAGGAEVVDDDLPPLPLSDRDLLARLGGRTLALARRILAEGLSATVRLGRPTEVHLPTCTLRFLVPWDLAHVRCDCAAGVDCPHVALAVWAVAACPSLEGEHQVALGGTPVDDERGQDVLDALRALQADLLRGGWSSGLEGLGPRIEGLRPRLEQARFPWLVDLLDGLHEALGDHDAGRGIADADRIGALVGELGLRTLATPGPGVPRASLVGEGTSGSTRLDHTVLRGLGARYRRRGEQGVLSVYLRDGSSQEALVLERIVERGEDGLPTGAEVGARRLLGARIDALASGTVTTAAATRRPNRAVHISRGATRQTAVVPGSGDELVRSTSTLSEVRERLAGRLPAPFRPRLRASSVVAVRWSDVERVAWDPGNQTVWALLADDGATAVVAAEWRPEAPGCAGALARALADDGPGAMAAEARLRDGALWLEPLLVKTASGLVVPDLEADEALPTLPVAELPRGDAPLTEALAEARAVLAELSRRGLAHLTRTQLERCRREGERLSALGLRTLGPRLAALASMERAARLDAWRHAWARVVVLQHLTAVTPVPETGSGR